MAINAQKQWIERLDDRFDALLASLTNHLSGYLVRRSLSHFDGYSSDQLEQGVVTLVSDGEGNYSTQLGMTARQGEHKLLIIGHLKVAETTEPEAIQAAEIELIEDIKSWMRSGVDGMSLRPERATQSRQLEHPYGWVLVELAAVSPDATIY